MLRTLIGPRKTELMAQARALLGEEAEMVDARVITLDDGTELFALLASNGEQPPSDEQVLRDWGMRSAHCVFTPDGRDLLRPTRGGEPITIAFVGPPGAGKTTTMAKIALHQRIFGRESLRVAFACLDTYRAGAVEQLRLYAEMAGASFQAVYTAEDAAALREGARDVDVLLVDAPGRAWRQENDLKQVKDILRALRPHETHLVLPGGLRPTIVHSWVDRYRRELHVTHLLPTKLDESPDDWAAFDVAARQRIPIRWIGEGQDIPDDIRSSIPRLARAILGHSQRHFGTER